jgi:hypothetical protein
LLFFFHRIYLDLAWVSQPDNLGAKGIKRPNKGRFFFLIIFNRVDIYLLFMNDTNGGIWTGSTLLCLISSFCLKSQWPSPKFGCQDHPGVICTSVQKGRILMTCHLPQKFLSRTKQARAPPKDWGREEGKVRVGPQGYVCSFVSSIALREGIKSITSFSPEVLQTSKACLYLPQIVFGTKWNVKWQ